MTKDTAIKLFNDKQIRTIWDDDQEKWFFSVVDVVGVLTESPNPNNYWKVLKHRLSKVGSELVTNCNHLKMLSSERLQGETIEQIKHKPHIHPLPSPHSPIIPSLTLAPATRPISQSPRLLVLNPRPIAHPGRSHAS